MFRITLLIGIEGPDEFVALRSAIIKTTTNGCYCV